MRTTFVTALLVLAGLLPLACSPDAPPEEATDPAEIPSTMPLAVDESLGQAPAFTLPTIQGDSLRLADFEGEVVLLNFWATWCMPCIAEMPDLMELHDELHPHGFSVVGISLDEEGPAAVQAFAERLDINYPLALDQDGLVADAFGGVWALPTTYIIGGDGKLLQRVVGVFPVDEMRPTLRAMLDLPPAAENAEAP